MNRSELEAWQEVLTPLVKALNRIAVALEQKKPTGETQEGVRDD